MKGKTWRMMEVVFQHNWLIATVHSNAIGTFQVSNTVYLFEAPFSAICAAKCGNFFLLPFFFFSFFKRLKHLHTYIIMFLFKMDIINNSMFLNLKSLNLKTIYISLNKSTTLLTVDIFAETNFIFLFYF